MIANNLGHKRYDVKLEIEYCKSQELDRITV